MVLGPWQAGCHVCQCLTPLERGSVLLVWCVQTDLTHCLDVSPSSGVCAQHTCVHKRMCAASRMPRGPRFCSQVHRAQLLVRLRCPTGHFNGRLEHLASNHLQHRLATVLYGYLRRGVRWTLGSLDLKED